MSSAGKALVRVATELGDVDACSWDACANPDPAKYNPFVSHTFLKALEDAGCVAPETGWLPQHLVLESADGEIAGCLPCYLKTHSQGEFVFDYAWAEAYERAGGDYYPKLLCAVPFTPVPGPRILVNPAGGNDRTHNEKLLASAAVQLAQRHEVSSLHINFVEELTWTHLGELGFLKRTDQQFHWHNENYDTFDEFLLSLSSRKRKTIRKERATAASNGLTIKHLAGHDIKESHWDAFFEFYVDTGNRKWGSPYLNRQFFSLLGERMADQCLLVLAERDGKPIAGALNIIGGDCLYGRYWGAIEHHPCLHFEVCYYQAIDYAIQHGLSRVEAGAQGEHKLARGYVPTTTYSIHWIADPGLRAAIARYLKDERRHVAHVCKVLTQYAPYKKA